MLHRDLVVWLRTRRLPTPSNEHGNQYLQANTHGPSHTAATPFQAAPNRALPTVPSTQLRPDFQPRASTPHHRVTTRLPSARFLVTTPTFKSANHTPATSHVRNEHLDGQPYQLTKPPIAPNHHSSSPPPRPTTATTL